MQSRVFTKMGNKTVWFSGRGFSRILVRLLRRAIRGYSHGTFFDFVPNRNPIAHLGGFGIAEEHTSAVFSQRWTARAHVKSGDIDSWCGEKSSDERFLFTCRYLSFGHRSI